MRRLRIISERTKSELGQIRLTPTGRALFDNDQARGLFNQFRHAGKMSDERTFDALADGWSNGYVTIDKEG